MFCWNDPRHALYHVKEIWSETVEIEPSYGQKTENLEFQTFSRDLNEGTESSYHDFIHLVL